MPRTAKKRSYGLIDNEQNVVSKTGCGPRLRSCLSTTALILVTSLVTLLGVFFWKKPTALRYIAISIDTDDGPDNWWGVTSLTCLNHKYEAPEPFHIDCAPFMGIEPDNTTCARPDSYMTTRCAKTPWCVELCGPDIKTHTVAPCAFAALSNLNATCARAKTILHSSRFDGRHLEENEDQDDEETAANIWCDRVAYCNLCGEECQKLVNPTLRMHHLFQSVLSGTEDNDDVLAAWVMIPMLRHFEKLCSCASATPLV